MRYQEPEFLPWDGRRVPITFIGGYLGAGKTTLINEVLLKTDRRVAVIVNDVGSLNIDAGLIRSRHGDVIEVTGGCVCCSSIDGMGAAFDQLRARPIPPDHLLVELSGVAEPPRMVPWARSAGFMLDGVVVVVAADQLVPGALPEWVQQHLAMQIVSADLLILTKTDLLDQALLTSARIQLASLAGKTPVIERNPTNDLRALGQLLSLGARHPQGPSATPPATLFDAHRTQTIAVPKSLSLYQLGAWLDGLPKQMTGRIVRVKGLVATTDVGLVLVQIVGARRDITSVPEPERQTATDLVIITLPVALPLALIGGIPA